jgi:ABC-type transporter Mla subunit MlaD
LNDANKAISHDDWDRAYQAFSKAKLIDPTNTAATEGERIAGQVRAGRQGLGSFLERPARLSSKAVAAAAQRLLASVRHLTAISPTLKTRSEQVSKLISQANKPVEVVVRSDGKTEISVRRVGIVGKTLEKVINLRPGDYTFEGKRAGYKSKLVKLTVPFNGTGLEIKIICDEQI